MTNRPVTAAQELRMEIDKPLQSNNDFQSLLNSIDIAVILLDRGLRINFFSPAAAKLFDLAPADIGRPLSGISGQLHYDDIQQNAEAVLDGPQAIPREVRTGDGSVYLMRVLPYRSAGDTVNGAVLVFLDITGEKRTEENLRRCEKRYRALFDSIDQGYCIMEILYDGSGVAIDALYLETNPSFENHTGIAEAAGKTIRQLIPDIEPKWLEMFSQVALTGERRRGEEESRALGRWLSLEVFPIGEADEKRVAMLFTDVTDRRRHEENQRFLSEISDELAGWN